jgi:hypothetical protein
MKDIMEIAEISSSQIDENHPASIQKLIQNMEPQPFHSPNGFGNKPMNLNDILHKQSEPTSFISGNQQNNEDDDFNLEFN